MLVGVFSDTHDRLPQIEAALACFGERKVKAILHAGDIVSPFAAAILARAAVPLYVIYGNNDGETEGLRKVLPQITRGPAEFDLDGRRIAMAHDFSQIPAVVRERAQILVAGHTHIPLAERREGKLWVNPGECCGWTKGKSTVAVLDTAALAAEIMELPLR